MTTITLPNGNQFNLIQLPTSPGLSQFSMTMIDSVAVVPSPYPALFVKTRQKALLAI
jgi:hypothetical protein